MIWPLRDVDVVLVHGLGFYGVIRVYTTSGPTATRALHYRSADPFR